MLTVIEDRRKMIRPFDLWWTEHHLSDDLGIHSKLQTYGNEKEFDSVYKCMDTNSSFRYHIQRNNMHMNSSFRDYILRNI
jgi:hypothetical protein